MKIQVLTNGFIASHLKYDKIIDRVQPTKTSVDNLLDTYKPDVLINCLGYAGVKNIDDCEINKEKTFASNTVIPILLAEGCEQRSIKLIHIASGCIFYTNSPEGGWKEDDTTSPLSTYSKSKYCADIAMSSFKDVLSYRIRMPISHKRNSRNLIDKLKNYNKLIDIPNSVSFVDDIVRAIEFGINNDLSGIFHLTNNEPLTAAQIMREYQKHDSSYKFDVIVEDELNKLVSAPRSNCILNNDKLKSKGFELTNSFDALENCLERYFKENK